MAIEIVSGDAAVANIASEACNLMLYSPPGYGKTTDAVMTWIRDNRCRAFVIQGDPGGLKPILARGLPIPDHTKRVVTTFEEVVEACMFAGSRRDLYDAVIFDGYSSWNETIVQALESRNYKNKYALWNEIRGYLFAIRNGCRQLGIHVVYIAHERQPWFDEQRNFHPGGPQMAPKTVTQQLVGGVDSILRIGRVNGQRVYFTGGSEWPVALGATPPADMWSWYTKNREGVNQAVIPADPGGVWNTGLRNFLQARRPPYAGV